MRLKLLFFVGILAVIYMGAFSTVWASDSTFNDDLLAEPALQQCGTINDPTQLMYPVNRDEFVLINPFSRPNARFDGRLHTGDDWVKREGESLGEPVYAIGPGRVMYSNPLGWGRDKGVIIIEHIIRDGYTFYALYGHIEELNDVVFPPSGTCVAAGELIGVIGDPRPAPHLHFEVRIFDPFTPGPGYWPIDPQLEGWLNPSQFIDNWRGWLHPAHRWHVVAGDADGLTPTPVLFDDGVVAYVDDQYLRYLDADGRLIQQYRLADSVEAIGLVEYNNDLLMATADGRLLTWSRTAGLITQWATGITEVVAGPYVLGDIAVIGREEGILVVDLLEQQPIDAFLDVGRLHYAVSSTQRLAVLTDTGLLILDQHGERVATHEVSTNSDVVATPSGFIVRDGTSLYVWQLDGTQRMILDDFDVNRTDSQLVLNGDQVVIWGADGPTRLMAVGLDGELAWQTDILGLSTQTLSRATVQAIDRCTIGLLTPQGVLLLVDSRNGRMMGKMILWGQNRTNVWLADTSYDGQIYLQVADQIAVYDLEMLSNTPSDYCR